MDRSAGLLLHISALPSPCGIGTLGKAAYDMVDLLSDSGIKYWQILPVTHASDFGNSPYQCYSAYAGNPLLIDLDLLASEGLIDSSEFENLYFGPSDRVDFNIIRELKLPLINKAASKALSGDLQAFGDFCDKEYWLSDYALYMALRSAQGDRPWYEWEDRYKFCLSEALDEFKASHASEILIIKMIQYLFFKQWYNLREYANSHRVDLFGDIPIYVSYDSAEVWAHPELFELDGNKRPIEVAGCPPDGFSEKGQKWGSPLYNYDLMEKDGYNWWINRIDYMCNLYNTLRIDHFRGFESYYAIPFEAEDARGGRWRKGPGMKLFNSLNYWMGRKAIVAEDLGTITPEVKKLLSESGYPGMKVLEFAFDKPFNKDNPYLPYNYDNNCVAYIGTHDNDTLKGWLSSLDAETLRAVLCYIGAGSIEEANPAAMRTILSSCADVAVLTPQDILDLPASARFNTPGTALGNWEWRLTSGQFSELKEKVLKLGLEVFGRVTA